MCYSRYSWLYPLGVQPIDVRHVSDLINLLQGAMPVHDTCPRRTGRRLYMSHAGNDPIPMKGLVTELPPHQVTWQGGWHSLPTAKFQSFYHVGQTRVSPNWGGCLKFFWRPNQRPEFPGGSLNPHDPRGEVKAGTAVLSVCRRNWW